MLTDKRHIYEKIFNLFRKRSRENRINGSSDTYSHIFLAYDPCCKDPAKSVYYATSERNRNFPEMVEMLIWEHLRCEVDSDNELTEERIRAHYNGILNRITGLGAKRLEIFE